jgi:hypothetical protein
MRNTVGGLSLAFGLAAACLFPAAVVAHPGSGILVDRHGQVYLLDTGSGLWRVNANGTLTRIPGPAFHWMAMDESGQFGKTRLPSGPGWEIDRAGSDPAFYLSSDFPIAMGRDANLYYANMPEPEGRFQILRLSPSGQSSVLAALPDTTANGRLRWINGLAAAPDGSLYYTENNAIRRINMKGSVSTVIEGIALSGCASIPGTESGARSYLRGLAVDAQGTVYVAASGCGRVLKITPDRQVSTVIQLQSPWSPTGIALFGSDLYVLEFLHTASKVEDRREWLPRVRKIAAEGKSAIIASIDRR